MLNEILKWRSDFGLPMLSEEEAWKMLQEEYKEWREASDKVFTDFFCERTPDVGDVYEIYKERVDMLFVAVQYDVCTNRLDGRSYAWNEIGSLVKSKNLSYHKELLDQIETEPEYKEMFERVLKSNYSKRTPELIPESDTFKYFRVQEKDGWFYYYNEDNKLIKPPTYQRWDQIPVDEITPL